MNESGFRDESDEEGRVETSGSSFCSCTGTFPRRGGSSASRGGGSNAAWSYLPGTTITHGLCHSAFRSGSNSSYPGGLILPSEPEIILPPGKQSLCLPKQDRNSFAYLPKLIFRLQYHLDGVLIPSSGVPFPYFIITENHLLLISADAEEVIDVSDTEQRNYYCRFFGEQLEKAEPLIAFNRNEKEMLERLRGEYAAAVQSGQKIYLITPQPCAMLTVTLDQLMMYWNDERIAGYWKLMNAMNAHEFTSPSGITRFLKSQMIVETGLNIPIRKEDMHLLREDIDKRLGKSLFLLNDDNIHMSEYWEMMIIDKEKVLFAPFYEGRFLISVSYDRIVEALADWCESRMQVANVDVMQNSRQ